MQLRVFVGGLEISDLVLRLAYFDGLRWHLNGVRLDPGVMEAGKVKDHEKFMFALTTLKSQVSGPLSSRKKISVIVGLSSVNIYSHVFSLPIIEKDGLDEAIRLNVQMVSPVDIAQVYSGWQIIGEDRPTQRLEVLSSFLDRSIADDIRAALLKTGFIPVAIEPRSLALTRLLAEEAAGFSAAKPYVMVHIDSAGLDFLIVSKGGLHFEYFNPWQDIVDEKGQIQTPAFEAAMARSLHQMVNFYSQHWPEPLTEIILSATSLIPETEKIVADNFSLPVRQLKSRTNQSVGSEWFVVLGCGLRGLKRRGSDKEMSLMGIGADDEFRREQAVNFLGFWRLIMPITLALLLIAFSIADLYLIQTRKSIESQSLFLLSPEQTKEIDDFTAQAGVFNQSVALVGAAQKSIVPTSKLWEKVMGLMAANGVTISHFSFQGSGTTILLTGSAPSVDNVSNFKKTLLNTPEFQGADLPIIGVKTAANGVTFSATFRYGI